MAAISLLVSDFIISFMWVWSGTLIKIFVHKILGLGHEPSGEVIQCVLSIINIFFFAFLGKITEGGAYNPLNVLASAISGNFSSFLFGVGARIPSQVIGSITGVKLIIETFPEIGLGPRLNIDIHRGALTEGFLAFAIVIISLGLATKIPGSFFMKTWISSVSKVTLHILGSDLTGGCMNPAAAMGWAYARGDHITKEHVLVYWLAPIEATLLAVWIFRLLVRPMKEEKANTKSKSE
ncbi:probable aquaporin SIP2-1 isoform X1 [Juglans microcarpa x Juglans regia]|uniref:probable aquaporin SIP2-1 isoform X1 n=1 Tax=Juglans microcarpa x Juglans regia TaxID=2249226 RepID=UPI001B7ECF1D|nr:probable aquaporin SIP2-1 isoform X1 [Juglans microcarpa x Juglans regia]